jgi:hypothetical protein
LISSTVQRELEGWRSTQVRGDNGVVYSDERVRAKHAVVAPTPEGALLLGHRYWSEVGRASRGSLRVREAARGVELRLLAFGPTLLRFGLPEVDVGANGVSCRYPIRGGLLARRPGGAIALSQSRADEPELRATVTAFVPRLALPLLYDRLQHRLHVRISRRYFRRLIAGGAG